MPIQKNHYLRDKVPFPKSGHICDPICKNLPNLLMNVIVAIDRFVGDVNFLF